MLHNLYIIRLYITPDFTIGKYTKHLHFTIHKNSFKLSV